MLLGLLGLFAICLYREVINGTVCKHYALCAYWVRLCYRLVSCHLCCEKCLLAMIIWDDGFFAEMDDSRMVYITGRLGSGKSCLAVELSERYLRKGYKLLSQVRCVWNDDPAGMVMDDLGRRKVCMWIDEVGLYFRRASTAGSVSSFARKQDMYLIFSGRKAPHEDLCDLTLQLWFDFFKWFLIPLKLWRYDRVNGKKSYHGYVLSFAWWEIFGIYDTLDPGDNPEAVVSLVKTWTEEYFARYGRKYLISDVDKSGGEDEVEFANEFASSVRKMGDATKEFASLSRGKKRWGG